MRRRIKATRFPEQKTVADFSQGVQLAFIQALARYWATDYNWRRCEAQLNSHPQFITEIDGLDTTLRAAQVRCIANREPEASEKWHLRGTRRKRRRIRIRLQNATACPGLLFACHGSRVVDRL
jgi:hypothetical protein